ncbi:hypothetical protein L3X38_000041 [Prunus dulcis]|uniref:Uncharacterized protein n=1 Tax=Prunus dulcis TaxID=3755 RepID=A0AAD4YH57_PRUDU|nr:hypothetical protein L3X38_000041 [Prunus dulcis]
MLFLLYWLNIFIFPNRSLAVLLEYKHLAEALHNHIDVGLRPIVLPHLYKNLHNATLVKSIIPTSVHGSLAILSSFLSNPTEAVIVLPQ